MVSFSTVATTPDVQAAARGDRAAFGRLVAQYQGVVAAITFAGMRNVAESEDVAQDVFVQAWGQLGNLRDPGRFLPWLRQIAFHRVVDAQRRRGRARLEPRGAERIAAAADTGPDALGRLIDGEMAALLASVLEELPEESREVVVLFYREGHSVEQVATLLGLREAAVRKRLARARDRLRAGLETAFGEGLRRSAPRAGFAGVVLAALPPFVPAAPAASAGGTAAANASVAGAVAFGAATVLVVVVAFAVSRAPGRSADPEQNMPRLEFGTAASGASGGVSSARKSGDTPSGTGGTRLATSAAKSASAPLTSKFTEVGVIRGMVLSSTGGRAAGVRVQAVCREEASREILIAPGANVVEAVTDGQGAFTLSGGLISGRNCHLMVDDPIHGAATASAAPGDDNVEIALLLGGSIRGIVTASNGTHLDTVSGSVSFLSEEESGSGEIENGVFDLRNVPAGSYQLRALLHGHPTPDPVMVTVARGEAVGTRLVSPASGVRVRGRLVNENGRPVPHGRMVVLNGLARMMDVEADEGGVFAIPDQRGSIRLGIWSSSTTGLHTVSVENIGFTGEVDRDLGDVVLPPRGTK